jgi:ubiquinone/menaquinone biosynthesis C-methylase UbiE
MSRDIEQWNEYSQLYDEGIGPEGDKLHAKFIDPIIFELYSEWEGKSILDAGCGNGYLINKIGDRAKEIVCVDSSEEMLKITKKNVQNKINRFVEADLTKPFQLEKETFDVVIANMVLQYLPSLTNFASESAKVLKKSGKLIIIIDSPAHALFLRAQELVGKKNEKFLNSDSYFKPGLRKKKSLWDKAVLQYYHRPLMEYFNAFTSHYRLEKVVENTEDGEMPRILGLLWTKLV